MGRKIIFHTISSLIIILTFFWYYNFRWVEFIPLEFNYKDDRRYGAWIERKEWWIDASKRRKKYFKYALNANYHDSKEINGTLYVRAYLVRDPNNFMNGLEWDLNTKERGFEEPSPGLANISRGFFSRYLGYNNFSLFLDKFFNWNWQLGEDKKYFQQNPKLNRQFFYDWIKQEGIKLTLYKRMNINYVKFNTLEKNKIKKFFDPLSKEEKKELYKYEGCWFVVITYLKDKSYQYYIFSDGGKLLYKSKKLNK